MAEKKHHLTGKPSNNKGKLKYGEPVKMIPFKIPVSKISAIKKRIKAILKEYEIKFCRLL